MSAVPPRQSSQATSRVEPEHDADGATDRVDVDARTLGGLQEEVPTTQLRWEMRVPVTVVSVQT